jgi:hypothetical protein
VVLRDYLSARRFTIESSIASEVLSGNEVKLQCERTALAEISGLEYFLFKNAADNVESAPSASTNTDYTAALMDIGKVLDTEYSSEFATDSWRLEQIRTVLQRLNTASVRYCA